MPHTQPPMWTLGYWHRRLPHHTREESFAQRWRMEHAHTDMLYNILFAACESMPEDERARLPLSLTVRERRIVATVVQWLGSNVGQSFLQEARLLHERTHGRRLDGPFSDAVIRDTMRTLEARMTSSDCVAFYRERDTFCIELIGDDGATVQASYRDRTLTGALECFLTDRQVYLPPPSR